MTAPAPLPPGPAPSRSRSLPVPLDLGYDLRHTLVALTILFESVCSGTIVPAPIVEGSDRWNHNGKYVHDGWEDVHRQSLNILLS